MAKARGLATASLALLLSASLLSGCVKKAEPEAPPKKQLTLDPQVVKSSQVSYYSYPEDPASAISPDGKYVLTVEQGDFGLKMAAVPLSPDKKDDVVLYSADAEWRHNNVLEYRVLGWLSDTQCLFVSSGWQNQGPNKDKRGVSVLTGNVAAGSAEEIAFIPQPQGHIHDAQFLRDKGAVYLDITGAFWAVDVKAKSARLIKENMPVYDGMFIGRLAPDGSAYVYQLHEPDGRQGIFRLDTATGEEKPLVLNRDTMSFYPTWSPDGNYLALYTAQRKTGASGTTWNAYEVYEGEDAAMPIGSSLTILDRSGSKVKSIAVEGKLVARFCWSLDAGSVAFVTGPAPSRTPNMQWNLQSSPIAWDGVWTAGIRDKNAAPVKMLGVDRAELGDVQWITPISFDATGRGVFFEALTKEDSTVWYVAKGKAVVQPAEDQAVKVIVGSWMRQGRSSSVFAGSLAGVISTRGAKQALWLVSPQGFDKVVEAPNIIIVGYNAKILVTSEGAVDQQQHTLVVRSMVTEK